jgi:predicted glycosyltransferase
MNGIGVGHIVRVSTLAEAIRSEWPSWGQSLQMFVITTSEATSILREKEIPFFKVPSGKTMEGAGVAYADYEYLGRCITSEVVRFMKPDLLIADTLPSGLFGELVPGTSEGALQHCRCRALIARPVRQDVLERPTFAPVLDHYDRIIVPEQQHSTAVTQPENIIDRVRFCGPIISTAPTRSTQRLATRRRFGIGRDVVLVLVSVGGGGHPDAEGIIHFVLDALASEAGIHIVVTAGPLYRGQAPQWVRNVTWLTGERTAGLLADVDFAISTAGYNSFNELMFYGIPTVFIPVSATFDDQAARAERGVQAGAAYVLSSLDPELLRGILSEWRDPIARGRAAEAARLVVPTNGALSAARELISLLR